MRFGSRTSGWSEAPVTVRDAIGAIALLAAALLPLGIPGLELGELHRSPPAWAAPVLAVAQTLPLTFRRVRPAFVLLVVAATFATAQLSGVDSGPAGLGVLVALYSTSAYHEPRRAIVAVSTVAGYVLLALALEGSGSPERLVDWVTFSLVLTVPWTAGLLVRHRLTEQDAREAAAAQEAVRRAKDALARDLHDVVTHHITAMVVQSESAAYLAPDDVAGRDETSEVVGRTGRQALQELRSLLGAMEQPAKPTPAASPVPPVGGDVRTLVEQLAATGYPVQFAELGEPSEPSAPVAATLHRVSQEALTNAMKHAPGQPVTVTTTHTADTIRLLIENRIDGGTAARPGRGLSGMAERVALVGGTLETGLVDRLFRVAAVLPRGTAR
ncbi:two-component sensor histidine kinase [Curtobacterium sp. MCPF17_047]|uniref:sensor histidine kinase n=1 Tax=Curtobacterium sp. MCPF17_047 TaxID=2175654 RepID=UPI000DA9A461|nr:histidine kinase [Curtobacterium sp. MCPF17_047]PZF66968.1 two-component sensor histidine kinase [Curtobacterium sp. MCPF17_047]